MTKMESQKGKISAEVIFLGGVFLEDQLAMVQNDSRGVIQNAADTLQKSLLEGLSIWLERVSVVNLPFVGGFPRGYRKLWFPPATGTVANGVQVVGPGFINLQYVKFLARFYCAFIGLHKALSTRTRPTHVMVYSAHLPFLMAARLARFFYPRTHICAIVPDLPEFMGTGGRAYRFIKAIESKIFSRVVRKFDSFVFLTEAMGERLKIPTERRVVVEGIHRSNPAEDVSRKEEERAILYTGTLAARYGVVDLLDAFVQLEDSTSQLWICGDGDSRSRVEALARENPRVKFFGQVPRTVALKLQQKAAVLVNPRRPEGEFTRYSFPSKTMEYLASGRPVVMYALPGIPSEYLEHLVVPEATGPEYLAASLDIVLAHSTAWRAARGATARDFIQTEKSSHRQVERIIALWQRIGAIF